MRPRFVIPFLLFLLLFVPPVPGIVRAGVKAGDWARYDVSQHFTGNATLAKSLVAQFSSYANTSYVSLTVTSVVGTNVSLTQVIHYTNGTSASSSSVTDVSQNIDTNNPPLVIMQGYPTPMFISSGNFSLVPRIINTIVVNPTSGDNSSVLRYSWDNATGILLSHQFLFSVDSTSANNATFAHTLVLAGTSLWHYVPPKGPQIPPPSHTDPLFAELYALVGVIGAVAVGIFAFVRKRPGRSKNQSRTAAASSRPWATTK